MNKKIAALTILYFTLFSSAFTKPLKLKDIMPKITLLDYMGKSEGKEIPSWVDGVIDGDQKSVIQKLGLNSSDVVILAAKQSDNFEDLLLKGRADAYIELVMKSFIYADKNLNEKSTPKNGLGFYLYAEESTESDYNRKLAFSYTTPYGIHNAYGSKYSFTEEFTKFTVTPYGDITGPDGKKLSDPYQSLFKWFRNSDNVRFDEFWTKEKSDISDTPHYNCFTVMSMSKENYEMITKWIKEEAEKELAEAPKKNEQFLEILKQKIESLNE